MKLPLVTRHAFDAVITQLHDANALIRQMAEHHRAALAQNEGHVIRILENHEIEAGRAEKRFADLMASYRMLKLQGAVEVAPPPTRGIASVDPVEAAICEECAGKDATVARLMRKQVAADRATGMADDEIIALIRRGERPAEEIAL